ncbi:MAG: amidohydrolase family protein [Anaerolineae bacterium]
MNRHSNRLLGIRTTVLLVLAFIAIACGPRPPQPSDTATPPVIAEHPTSPPETPTAAPSASRADVIFHNGAILTMEADQPRARALAIQGVSILAVGSDDEILALAGAETHLIDLQGRALMPGFVDAHSHILASPDHYGTDLEGIQDLALMYGITTLADAGGTPELLERIQALEQESKLRVRTSVYMVYIDNCGDVMGDWYIDYAPTREPGEMLRIGGVKIFTDGGSCNAPAVSFEYPNGVGQGDLYFTQEELDQVVADVQARGYQAAIHALGDRAVEQAQDAIAAALSGQPNTLRHRIEHNAVLRPDLMGRYSEIGIVPLIFGAFPTCAKLGMPTKFRYAIPVEYQTWEWPWRELLDANPGLPIAWHGDDPPLPPLDPLIDLYGFVTRREIAEDGSICEPSDWLAANAITVEEALRMMTMGSAYALFRDEEVGSLAPGKFADVIILSEDPVTVDPNTIKDIEVLMTMVGGRVEYCAPGYEALCRAP